MPLQTLLQQEALPEQKGTVLAFANFLAFSGMLFALGALWLLLNTFNFDPGQVFCIVGAATTLLREGVSTGQLRMANVPHLLLTLVGATVFPFASGEFGQEVLGKDIFDPGEVRRRKREVRDLLRLGLAVNPKR